MAGFQLLSRENTIGSRTFRFRTMRNGTDL